MSTINEKIKLAFDEIHAEEELKDSTKNYILSKTKAKQKTNRLVYAVPVLITLVFLFVGFSFLYFTPTTMVSIDINPSIELYVNRYDRVISAKAYNEDGKKILSDVSVYNLTIDEALDIITNETKISNLLSNDAILEIGISSDEEEQEERIIDCVNSCSLNNKNICYYETNHEEIEEAHDVGMSCGKYRVYKELVNEGVDITPEEAQNMSMKELKELLSNGDEQYSAEYDNEEETICEETHTNSNGQNHGHNGNANVANSETTNTSQNNISNGQNKNNSHSNNVDCENKSNNHKNNH